MERERRGPGRPPLPEGARAQVRSFSMYPKTFALLQMLSKRTKRSMAALLAEGIGLLRDLYGRK